MNKTLTPHDFGYELATEPKLETNRFNIGGNKCKSCSIKETCLLPKHRYECMCFEALQKILTQTDVCKKVLNKEVETNEDTALHLYIDSMLFHLNNLPDVKTTPLDLFTRWDILSDLAIDDGRATSLTPKHAAICRLFGRQAIDILRERGYNF